MKLLDNIYKVLKDILLSRTQEAKLYDDSENINLQKIHYLRYRTQKKVKVLEELINEYFNRKQVYNKLRVKYDDEWHHLMIKQPWLHKIKRNDPKLIVLKRIVDKARSDTGTDFSDLVGATNLIDIPITINTEYLRKKYSL